jgi:hypothetical protein
MGARPPGWRPDDLETNPVKEGSSVAIVNPFGPDLDWYPWDKVEEIDRGFGTCRVRTNVAGKIQTNKLTRRLWAVIVGECAIGMTYIHLCERYLEPNRCICHVVIGSHGTNMKHHHMLRRAAGVQLERSDEWIARQRASHLGHVNGPIPQLHERSVCPRCGRSLNSTWMTRHRNEGGCLP